MVDPEDAAETRGDFMRAAAHPEGSRDLGAQLFCALLRSAGVNSRLVCSLQPLPFANAAPLSTATPSKHTIDLSSSALDCHGNSGHLLDDSGREPSPTPTPIRRFGRKIFDNEERMDIGKAPTPSKRRVIRDSSYPVYWVEAFNTAKQQWLPVDPFATRTVNKPGKMEPPASDPYIDMSYVLAFNEDGTAKDVTRRYAKAYNAKTRRSRVEGAEGGERWFRRVLKTYRNRTGKSDTDMIEDAELDHYEAKEPMPRNVQDFKGHPYYALERHLKRHEAIHPKREVGKLRVGKAENSVEPVYRRRDVHICKTADKWYRSGRELKEGEQPLKRVTQRRRRERSPPADDLKDSSTEDTVGLFGIHQTELYAPPPCANGKVPKNAYKNLDVYAPSMIPPGAVHVRSSDGVAAAKILRLDFAEAVTGFQFKGRHGTAILRGVIVCSEFREAMEETIEAIRFQRYAEEQAKRVRLMLNLWKRFMTGLRVRERVMSQTSDAVADIRTESGSEYEDDQQDTEGGFLVAEATDAAAHPTTGADRDAVKEKFKDDFAEIINEDPLKRAKQFWEPTVLSPWDVPGLLAPLPTVNVLENEQQPSGNQDVSDLFEEPMAEGGFIRDEIAAPSVAPSTLHEEKDTESLPIKHGSGIDEPYQGAHLEDERALQNRTTPNMAAPKQNSPASEKYREPRHSPSADTGESFKPQEGSHTGEATRLNESSKSNEDNGDSDAQSLLLEDPDDEDMEPDWLADAAVV